MSDLDAAFNTLLAEHNDDPLRVEFSNAVPMRAPRCSRYEVNDRAEFRCTAQGLLQQSSLILVQEYTYTEFDWRIGDTTGPERQQAHGVNTATFCS